MRTIPPESIRVLCAAQGFSFGPALLESLASYLSLLTRWNRVMNLVGPTDWESILSTLVVDSFHLAGFLDALPLPEEPLCQDLGAGAGLPGIPLRMIWRKGGYTLVESREKRALFLRAVLASCPLPGVRVFHGRAETFMAGGPQVTLTVSRAFMPWERVLELVAGHTRAGGMCVFLALAPAPSSLPPGWSLAAEKSYLVGDARRWFRALRREKE
jgi:16S rRNA (guanine527-N7)-methyltransferase